jgi:EmrB/QacA subfamily drug resistance transporter
VDNATRRIVLLITTLASFFTPFMSSSINVALPAIGADMSLNASLLGWVATSYLLATAMFVVPFGKVADIRGRKRIFAYGVVVFSLASLLCGLSGSIGFLLAFRVVQGIGSAMMFGTSTAILTSAFPPGERGRALGINIGATYIGLSIGPFLGGLLTERLGWQSIFFVNVPVGLAVVLLLVWKLAPEWAEARGERFDYSGSAVYMLSLFAIMYGLSLLPDAAGIGLLAFGLLGTGAFVLWEARAPTPVLNVRLLRHNTTFALSNAAALINYAATAGVSLLMSLYLQYIKGLPAETAGLILVAQPIMQAIFSPYAGRLSDRIESRIVASAGMAIIVVGLAALAFLQTTTSLAFIIVSLMLLGFGFALFSSPNTNAIMSSVEKRYYGVGSAMVATMRLIGQMLSLGIATLLVTLFVGRVEITPAHYPSFLTSVRTAFVVFAALCVVGTFASLARGNVHREAMGASH